MRIRIALPVLSIIVASTHAAGGLKGAGKESSGKRGLQNNGNSWYDYYSSNTDYYDANNNDDGNGDASLSNTTLTSTGSSTASGKKNFTDSMHEIQGMVINQVQQYKVAAEAKGYEFYQTAPSEWTANQWDFVCALFGGLLVACCLVSLCCAHCCIYRGDQDDALLNTTEYKKRMLSHKILSRSRYNDRRYEQDDETLYTVDSGSTYGQQSTYTTYTAPDSPSTCESSVYIPRKSKRDSKRESLLQKNTSMNSRKLSNVIVKMGSAPKNTKTSSTTPTKRPSTPKICNSPKSADTLNGADDATVDDALNYKMHP